MFITKHSITSYRKWALDIELQGRDLGYLTNKRKNGCNLLENIFIEQRKIGGLLSSLMRWEFKREQRTIEFISGVIRRRNSRRTVAMQHIKVGLKRSRFGVLCNMDLSVI